jgi:hypothetical protein
MGWPQRSRDQYYLMFRDLEFLQEQSITPLIKVTLQSLSFGPEPPLNHKQLHGIMLFCRMKSSQLDTHKSKPQQSNIVFFCERRSTTKRWTRINMVSLQGTPCHGRNLWTKEVALQNSSIDIIISLVPFEIHLD